MNSSDTSPVLLHREDGVAWLVFNRPQQFNTLDVATAECFLAHCQAIAADRSVRAVVLRGEGRGFGAGGDLTAFRGSDPAAAARAIIEPMHEAVKILSALDAPVIASLHGTVAGGSLSLALACDLALAAEGTKFNLAYVNVAANCDVSGSWNLPRVVGLRNAMAIALLGESFGADEALRLGIVNRVVPADELGEATRALALKLAQGPTLAIGRMKRLLRSSLDNDLATQLDAECEAFQASTRTQDFAEAMAAFAAKRAPVFQGR